MKAFLFILLFATAGHAATPAVTFVEMASGQIDFENNLLNFDYTRAVAKVGGNDCRIIIPMTNEDATIILCETKPGFILSLYKLDNILVNQLLDKSQFSPEQGALTLKTFLEQQFTTQDQAELGLAKIPRAKCSADANFLVAAIALLPDNSVPTDFPRELSCTNLKLTYK